MGNRSELHNELLNFTPNVYFQPPSNLQLSYPCIIYDKTPSHKNIANNGVYIRVQGYDLTVVEKTPDNIIAEEIETSFQYCSITQYFKKDNLNQTKIKLYY